MFQNYEKRLEEGRGMLEVTSVQKRTDYFFKLISMFLKAE